MPTDPRYLSRLMVWLVFLACGIAHGQQPRISSVLAASPTDQVPTWTDGTIPQSIVTSRSTPSVRSVAPPIMQARYTSVTPHTPIPRYGHCNGCRCSPQCALPLGTSLNAYLDAHIANGRRGQLILYHYDFEQAATDRSARLNPHGKVKLQRLLPWLEASGGPLIVQHVPGQRVLSEARRAHVLEVAQRLGASLDARHVILGIPRLPGLRGVEAAEIDRNQLQTTRSQGTANSGFQAGLTNDISAGSGNRP